MFPNNDLSLTHTHTRILSPSSAYQCHSSIFNASRCGSAWCFIRYCPSKKKTGISVPYSASHLSLPGASMSTVSRWNLSLSGARTCGRWWGWDYICVCVCVCVSIYIYTWEIGGILGKDREELEAGRRLEVEEVEWVREAEKDRKKVEVSWKKSWERLEGEGVREAEEEWKKVEESWRRWRNGWIKVWRGRNITITQLTQLALTLNNISHYYTEFLWLLLHNKSKSRMALSWHHGHSPPGPHHTGDRSP